MMNIELESMAIQMPAVVGHPNREPFRGVLTLVDVVSDKAPRVANFHRNTMRALAELLGAAGLSHPDDIKPWHLQFRHQGLPRQALSLGRHHRRHPEQGLRCRTRPLCTTGRSSPDVRSATAGCLPLPSLLVPAALARGAIRFTLGHDTSDADIERALAIVPGVIASLRHAP